MNKEQIGGAVFRRFAATSREIIDGRSGSLPMCVRVSEFALAETLVTQQDYQAVMGENPSHYPGPRRPVENVTWYEALRYCNARSIAEGLDPCYDLATGVCDLSRVGFRLPTEAEWRIAAGELSTDTFTSERAHIGQASTTDAAGLMRRAEEVGTADVGSYPPNEHGLYDLAGNVWEWCYDLYSEEKDIPRPTCTDPVGPSRGLNRVVCGGSFVSAPAIFLARNYHGQRSLGPDQRSRFTGFRLCVSGPRLAEEITYGRADEPEEEFLARYDCDPEAPSGREDLPSQLVGDSGNSIESPAEWEARREALCRQWRERLGVPPEPDRAPQVRTVLSEETETYRGRVVFLEWPDGIRIKLYVALPHRAPARPLPTVVVHSYDVDAPMGRNLGGTHYRPPSDLKNFGEVMVRAGFAAVVVQFFFTGAESLEESMVNLRLHHPEANGLGRLVWDIGRVVDYLATQPEVDAERIGLIGHCAGGIATLFDVAFERRIKAAVACGPAVSVGYSNYADYWYLGEEVCREIDKGSDLQQVLSLTAPRPLLLNLVKGNPIQESWKFVNAAREVYALYGRERYLSFIYDLTKERSAVTAWAVERMRDWLCRFL